MSASATPESSPLQVYLDAADRERLDAWSKQRGWTKSDAIRAAIRALVNVGEHELDPLLGASGMIRGLPRDASAAFDRYLAETFNAQTTSSRPKRPRKRASKPRVRR